jgi:putative dimethyl sulfoxide reductase chaperone
MTKKDELIVVSQDRRAFYNMLARFYYRPLAQDEIEQMARTDYTQFYAEGEQTLFAEGFNDINRYLRRLNTGTRQELAVDYTSAYGGTKAWKGAFATPCESLFNSVEHELSKAPRHEVFKIYKRNALKLEDIYNTPDDHISFMFQFMGVLCDRIAEALDEDDYEAARTLLKEQEAFLSGHIRSWFDEFHELAEHILKTRFYQGVMKVTAAFLELEVDTIDDMADSIEDLKLAVKR